MDVAGTSPPSNVAAMTSALAQAVIQKGNADSAKSAAATLSATTDQIGKTLDVIA